MILLPTNKGNNALRLPPTLRVPTIGRSRSGAAITTASDDDDGVHRLITVVSFPGKPAGRLASVIDDSILVAVAP